MLTKGGRCRALVSGSAGLRMGEGEATVLGWEESVVGGLRGDANEHGEGR